MGRLNKNGRIDSMEQWNEAEEGELNGSTA